MGKKTCAAFVKIDYGYALVIPKITKVTMYFSSILTFYIFQKKNFSIIYALFSNVIRVPTYYYNIIYLLSDERNASTL